MREARPLGPGQLIVLALLGGIAPLGTDIYLPSIPAVATDLHAAVSTVQLTLTGFMAGLALGPLIIGPVSDRFGRYRLLLVGILALLASSVLCALAPTVGVLIAARVVQGFCGSIALTLCRAMVADLATGAGAARIYSLLGTIMGLSPIVAPIIGGVIQQWAHWRVSFWVLAGLCALLLVGALTLLRETLPPELRQRGGLGMTARNAARVVRDPHFVTFALALCCTSGALFSYISASPFVVQGILGWEPLAYSGVFAVNAAGLTTAAGISAATVGRLGPVRLVRVGSGAILVGASALAVAAAVGIREPGVLLPAMFLIPTGAGFVFGNATALATQTVRYAAGTAIAVIGFLQFGMSGLVAPLVSVAGPDSIAPFAVIALAAGILLAVFAAVGARVDARTRAASPRDAS